MGKDLIDVTLNRTEESEQWGFRLAGGKDHGQPLSISQVASNSLAAKVGVNADDFLVSIGGLEVHSMTHAEAERTIMEAGNRFSMVIERESNRKISFEKSATTFALKLGSGGVAVERKDEAFISNVPITEETPAMTVESVNFNKFTKKPTDLSSSKTLEEMSQKVNMRKDWNCPWVRRDGSGIKQAVRYIDEPTAQARTSAKHYYSEPRSILNPDPVLTKEQLQAIIREQSRPESRQQEYNNQDNHDQEVVQEEFNNIEECRQEKEIRQEQEVVVDAYKEDVINVTQEKYCREREEDSQAPPDLEPVVQQGFVMPGQFQGQEEGYEPSADELIDVLKNLENLAAGNPNLYRSIVDQIQGSTSSFYQQTEHQSVQQNGSSQFHQEQQYEQQQQLVFQQQEQQLVYQQQVQQLEEEQRVLQYQQKMEQEQQMMREDQYEEQLRGEQQQTVTQETFSQHQVEESMAQMNMSEDEYKQHMKMKRLEAEAQEEVRQTLAAQREAKMKKLKDAEPKKTKEITVLAGDGKTVKLQLGGDSQENSRKQVAEAAGLKHVPLPDFENTDNSAWAGSLRKTSKIQNNQSRDEDDDANPWAGSLRHVQGPKKDNKREDKEDMYGGAPWMGTLRHIVHDNKVTKNYGVNKFQSKRYPDEDATNPFEGSGGTQARPAFPLTPAAVINGSVMSRDEMARREEEEELERIRKNIGSKTVSSALLQVLMPKLLKMHETKYTPMDRLDAAKIMEEILSMQIGINPDQQADANEEAEMIIRAIMQDEVDKSVYSRMADDLEAGNQKMKKVKKVKKVKTTPGITA